jgi:organic radical activating enzyme
MSIQDYTPERLHARIRELANRYQSYLLILTGGEPTEQNDLGDLVSLVSKDSNVVLETNGTNALDTSLCSMLQSIVVSPKKTYFKTPKKRREFFKNWKRVDAGYHNVYYTFVVGKSAWMWAEAEIKDVVVHEQLDKRRVWVMPSGITLSELRITGPKTWKIAKRYGYNFSWRTDVYDRS